MKDYFLRTANIEEMDSALRAAGLISEMDGEEYINVTSRRVGTLYEPTGEMLVDEDGNEYAEMKPIEGYHVNLRAELTAEQQALLPIIDCPRNPQAIFAGGVL